MAFHKKNIETVINTGFGTNSSAEGGRLTNKDGSVNLVKTGIPFWERISLYHSLLKMRRWKFLLSIFLFYTVINLVFATIYVSIGTEHLNGTDSENTIMGGFLQAFFFSSQTLTTVGYGHVSPSGLTANVVASLESFLGILSFALVTGLLYGRFTRPKAYLKFSDHAIIAPHKGGKAVMVRLATYKNNHLTEVESQLTIALHVQENDKKVTRFYTLKLEIARINSLALSWTLVHLIDEDSPLYMMNHEDMKEAHMELMVFIKAFDDHFSNTVQQRTSYSVSEIIYGAKFLPMFHKSEDGSATILELDRINAYEPATVPEPETSLINN